MKPTVLTGSSFMAAARINPRTPARFPRSRRSFTKPATSLNVRPWMITPFMIGMIGSSPCQACSFHGRRPGAGGRCSGSGGRGVALCVGAGCGRDVRVREAWPRRSCLAMAWIWAARSVKGRAPARAAARRKPLSS